MNAVRKYDRLVATAAWLSIVVNIILFIFKFYAGRVSGSMAIKADSWHTLSDSMTSLIVIFSLRFARIPADKKHPFGHGRTELIATLAVAMILAMVGFGFMKESVQKLLERGSAEYGVWAIVVSAATVVIKEAVAQFSFAAARKSGSRALKADGWHHRSDAITSLVILAGILLGRKWWWIDAALGMAVSLLILFTAFELFREASSPLLGESISEELVDSIKKIALSVLPKGSFLHHFHLHSYGDHRELSFHIKLEPEMTIRKGHDLCDRLEQRVRSELNIEATIHMEPLREAFKPSEGE